MRGFLRWQAKSDWEKAGQLSLGLRQRRDGFQQLPIEELSEHSRRHGKKEEMAAWNPWFPANFIGETTGTELAVLVSKGINFCPRGQQDIPIAWWPSMMRASAAGHPITPAAPRPVIYSNPMTDSRDTAPEHASLRLVVTRSLGDLSARMKGDQLSQWLL